MASTFAVTRNHLTFGLCLPLAVLMGYLLAEPLESASLVILVMILSVLIIPILIRWYHPLLIVSWNAVVYFAFLPGSPRLSLVMSLLGLFFAIINRSVNPNNMFLSPRMLTHPMLALMAVVLITAFLTGGMGMRIIGSGAFGGKNYFYVMGAVAGYFALTSATISPHRASLAASIFFLSGMSSLICYIGYELGNKGEFLFLFFPIETILTEIKGEALIGDSFIRYSGLTFASIALFCFTLARYGIEGLFQFRRPWRMVLFLLSLATGAYSGFRSNLILMLATFLIMFVVQQLWRTRLLLVLMVVSVLSGAFLVGFASKLPFPIQRAISFLPVQLDYVARESAESSSEWRLEIWRLVIPEIPKYLLLGKGYIISPDELFMAQEMANRGNNVGTWETAILSGDYHNGPLSVIIPFGIWGVAAFGWLLIAGARYLYQNFRASPPELRIINAFLLSFFLARIVYFTFVFGALSLEIFQFTGILGLSVAINTLNTRKLEEDVESSFVENE